MFDAGAVLAVFEEATGVSLELEDPNAYDELRARFPMLDRVQNYVSPKLANDRFDGHFLVRIYPDRDDPDEGVIGEYGLERDLPERGPGGYQVSAQALRTNVEVMFWSDSAEITPKAKATWALLISCLQRL
jgi:hypothetical protein